MSLFTVNPCVHYITDHDRKITQLRRILEVLAPYRNGQLISHKLKRYLADIGTMIIRDDFYIKISFVVQMHDGRPETFSLRSFGRFEKPTIAGLYDDIRAIVDADKSDHIVYLGTVFRAVADLFESHQLKPSEFERRKQRVAAGLAKLSTVVKNLDTSETRVEIDY